MLQVLLQSNEDLSEAEEEKKPFFEDKAYIEDDTHLQLQDDEVDLPDNEDDDFEPYVEDDDHLQLLSQEEEEEPQEPLPIHTPEPEPESQQEGDLDTPLLETKRWQTKNNLQVEFSP